MEEFTAGQRAIYKLLLYAARVYPTGCKVKSKEGQSHIFNHTARP